MFLFTPPARWAPQGCVGRTRTLARAPRAGSSGWVGETRFGCGGGGGYGGVGGNISGYGVLIEAAERVIGKQTSAEA